MILMKQTEFSPFQDQADQSKQVTYSVSGGSGFKVKLKLCVNEWKLFGSTYDVRPE